MTTHSISNAVVWPEDYGTGANVSTDAGDYTSAGHLGTMSVSQGTGYVEAGMSLNYNPSDTTLDIGAGLSFALYTGGSDVQDGTGSYAVSWGHPIEMLVSVPSVANLALDTGAVNDVYLAVDPTGQNSARYVFGASVSEPTDPSIKLGTVDTSTDEVTTLNTAPDASFEDITAETISVTGGGIDFNNTNASNIEYVSFEPASQDIGIVRDPSPPSDPTPFTWRYDGRDIRWYNGDNGIVSLLLLMNGDVEVPSGGLTVSGTAQASDLNATDSVSAGTDVSTPALAGGITGGSSLTSLTGSNLSISGGELTATDTDTNTHTAVSHDGAQVLADVADINFTDGLNATDDGDGSVSVTTDASVLYMSDYIPAGGVCDSEFDAAINDASAGDTIIFDHNTYELTSGHVIGKSLTIDQTSDTELSFTNTANNNAHIEFRGGGTEANTTTDAEQLQGDRQLSVVDASLFAERDRVMVLNGTYSETVNARVHFDQIESADTTNNNIELSGGLYKEFPSGATVYRIGMLKDPEIRNLQTSGGGTRHLQFTWCESPSFRNVSISEYLETSLYTLNCWKPHYQNVEALDPMGVSSGEGEPLAAYRSTDVYIEAPRIYDCRRGIDLAWGAQNVAIVDPVIRGVKLNGISVHQDNESGAIMVTGGEIVCDPAGQSGNGISTSSSATLYVDGIRIVAREQGIICNGQTHATNCTIETTEGAPSAPLTGFHVMYGDATIRDCYVDDPDGNFDFPVWIDGDGTNMQHITIDIETTHKGTNHIYFDARNGDLSDIRLSGYLRNLDGTSDRALFLRADTTYTISDVHVTELTATGLPNQAVRMLSEGTEQIDRVTFDNCTFETGKAAIYSDGTGTFGSIRVTDCDCDTGGTSLSFNETVARLRISGNETNGSIDTTGATVVDGFLAAGTVSLSSGAGTISTGVTQPLDVYIDPSNGGSAGSDVDVVASVRYDASAGENVVEIAEDSTAVGSPTIAYTITGRP